MAVRKVLLYPDPILEEVCEPVTTFDKKLGKLLDDMYETMMAYDGVGLAAPQIGIRKQIAVVYADDETGKIELINPQILEAGGEQTDVEGCLSFPGLYGEVSRPYYVKVRAQNRKGKFFCARGGRFSGKGDSTRIGSFAGDFIHIESGQICG